MSVQYIDEAGDLQYYHWYRNPPIKWFTYKMAWRRLNKRVKLSNQPIEFTGANKIITHEVEIK